MPGTDVTAARSESTHRADSSLPADVTRLLTKVLVERLANDLGDGNPTRRGGAFQGASLLLGQLYLGADH